MAYFIIRVCTSKRCQSFHWSAGVWIGVISRRKWKLHSCVSCKDECEIVGVVYFPCLNWCVVFSSKLSETLQVQIPAVPPGPCQPPRLVGKPKAREVQLRWGESFFTNLALCGGWVSSSNWCIYLSKATSRTFYLCVLCTLFIVSNTFWRASSSPLRPPSGRWRKPSNLLQCRSERTPVRGEQGGVSGPRTGLLCGRVNAWKNLQLPPQSS